MSGEHPAYTTERTGGKAYIYRDMPSREELLSRNSFGNVNNNRHLDKVIQAEKNKIISAGQKK